MSPSALSPQSSAQISIRLTDRSDTVDQMCCDCNTVSMATPNDAATTTTEIAQIDFICHVHNYTEYNQQWNVSQVRSMDSAIHMEYKHKEYA